MTKKGSETLKQIVNLRRLAKETGIDISREQQFLLRRLGPPDLAEIAIALAPGTEEKTEVPRG